VVGGAPESAGPEGGTVEGEGAEGVASAGFAVPNDHPQTWSTTADVNVGVSLSSPAPVVRWCWRRGWVGRTHQVVRSVGLIGQVEADSGERVCRGSITHTTPLSLFPALETISYHHLSLSHVSLTRANRARDTSLAVH
jgi:hypothetical protein